MLGRSNFGRMRGNVMGLWLRKITRKFNVPSDLRVGVLAVLAWLACVLVGLCELLTRSKLA
nr:MAG TPA: hypothetical protein [Caudoviricetes sp.]